MQVIQFPSSEEVMKHLSRLSVGDVLAWPECGDRLYRVIFLTPHEAILAVTKKRSHQAGQGVALETHEEE